MTIELTFVLKQTFSQDIKWCRTRVEMSHFHAGGMGAPSIDDAGDIKRNEKVWSAIDILKLYKLTKLKIRVAESD